MARLAIRHTMDAILLDQIRRDVVRDARLVFVGAGDEDEDNDQGEC